MKKQQGFTLIELLVVIAIIGVLSAVVLASLNTARDKGSDAAIMSDLDGIRTQAQLYYSNNTNSYTNMCTADATIKNQIAGAENANGTGTDVVCNPAADGKAYAVSSILFAKTDAGGSMYYCVDSAGTGTTTTTALVANGATVCQ